MIGVRDYLRPAYHAARERLARLDRAIDRRVLTRAELEQLLGGLSIKPGATVLVHSSMGVVARRVPELTPVELIRMLQRLVTESGTLLMPTFPFTGKQAHYADRTSRFDVRRTPSQVGLMPEVFRRMSDVARSLHPTHPFAAWGRHARTLLADHHRGGAFATSSPIYRLREFDGVVVGLGTGLRDSFTILHVPEEIHLKARARFFESHNRTMIIVGEGHEISYTFHALRPDVRRNYNRVERVLVREGVLRYVTSKGLRCAVTNSGEFIDRCMRLVDEGRYL